MFQPHMTEQTTTEVVADDTIFTTHARLPDGDSHALPAPAGWRLMEVLRDYGLPIRAECGGACACATCHIRVIRPGRVPLEMPEDDELDRLDTIFDADDSSRLACQILTGPQTDGLIIALATDSVSTDPVSSSPVPADWRGLADWRGEAMTQEGGLQETMSRQGCSREEGS